MQEPGRLKTVKRSETQRKRSSQRDDADNAEIPRKRSCSVKGSEDRDNQEEDSGNGKGGSIREDA